MAVRLPEADAAAGLRARTEASQVLGAVKFQLQRGSTVPALACTTVSASSTRFASDCVAKTPKPGGWSRLASAFDIVMA